MTCPARLLRRSGIDVARTGLHIPRLHEPALNDHRRYLSLGVLALSMALVYGIWYSYSVIMVALLREYGWSRSVLAGAFSVFTLAHGMANPVMGWLCGRVRPPQVTAVGGVFLGAVLWLDSYIETPWHLYLGFGVFTAVAVSASGWIPVLVQVQRRFPDRLGLALGIVSSGVGLGMLLVVPLFQMLIDAYGWRMAFRVLGVGLVAWLLPASYYLLRTMPVEPASGGPAAARGAAAPSSGLAGIVRTRPFWLLMATFFFGNVCAQTLHVHQVAYLVDHGMATILAASVVSVVGAASIVTKIGSGWISDIIDREFVFMACMAILVASVGALVLVGLAPTRWGAYTYALLLGAGYSVTASLIPAMASDRFSGPHFSAVIGIGLFGSAVGSALGPWLAGWLFDLSGTYALPLSIAAVCGVLAGAAAWGLRVLRLRAG